MGEVKQEILVRVVELAARLGHVFVATADGSGVPHVAAAGKIALEAGQVEVTAWFCPVTVTNLRHYPAVSLVVWSPATDTGYQLVGRAVAIEETAVLDGYFPEEEAGHPLPQMERKLVIRPDEILDFKHAPHSDVAAG